MRHPQANPKGCSQPEPSDVMPIMKALYGRLDHVISDGQPFSKATDFTVAWDVRIVRLFALGYSPSAALTRILWTIVKKITDCSHLLSTGTF
jgi:hypothetical protein